jgi:hypothetical protein
MEKYFGKQPQTVEPPPEELESGFVAVKQERINTLNAISLLSAAEFEKQFPIDEKFEKIKMLRPTKGVINAAAKVVCTDKGFIRKYNQDWVGKSSAVWKNVGAVEGNRDNLVVCLHDFVEVTYILSIACILATIHFKLELFKSSVASSRCPAQASGPATSSPALGRRESHVPLSVATWLLDPSTTRLPTRMFD